LGFPHGMSVKFGLWTFHKLEKRLNNFDFWLPCWSCLCYCQNKPMVDPRDPCGWPSAPGTRLV